MTVKVLVVDDKQMMRDSVAATLQRAGYQAIAAADGDTAIRAIARIDLHRCGFYFACLILHAK